MMNAYMNVYATMLNICKRFKEEHPEHEFSEVMDFDANVAENEYPSSTILGIYQFEYNEDHTMIYAKCAFPITTVASEDTMRLNQIVGEFAQFVKAETRHPLFNMDTGVPIGLVTARDDLFVSPMVKTTNRQFKFVLQTFVFDRTSAFVPGRGP